MMVSFQDGTVTIKLDEEKLGNAYAWTNYTVEVSYTVIRPCYNVDLRYVG